MINECLLQQTVQRLLWESGVGVYLQHPVIRWLRAVATRVQCMHNHIVPGSLHEEAMLAGVILNAGEANPLIVAAHLHEAASELRRDAASKADAADVAFEVLDVAATHGRLRQTLRQP